jgi:hypothetical protein
LPLLFIYVLVIAQQSENPPNPWAFPLPGAKLDSMLFGADTLVIVIAPSVAIFKKAVSLSPFSSPPGKRFCSVLGRYIVSKNDPAIVTAPPVLLVAFTETASKVTVIVLAVTAFTTEMVGDVPQNGAVTATLVGI